MPLRSVISTVFLICFALSHAKGENKTVNGAVLQCGQSLVATNKNGSVRITYLSSLKRKYAWNGNTRIVKLIPMQPITPNVTGLYEPADFWGINPFLIRLVAVEATHEFESMDQIYRFLRQSSLIMDWVYTNEGLVVGFGKCPARQQIDIYVWQLLLNGKKPSGLKGANPKAIQLISQ
jgi:hypothetical protein